MTGEIIVGALLALATIGLCELVRRITLWRVKPECIHPRLEQHGVHGVACIQCDRVWTSIKTYELRGGHDDSFDYRCENPYTTECALSECQERKFCQYNIARNA